MHEHDHKNGGPNISRNVGENSLFKCASQPEIVINSLKLPIFGFQGRSRSSMLVPPESSACYDKQHVCLSATVLMLD